MNTLVTGGTSGIGAAIVRKILEEGGSQDRVVVNYGHDREKAETFVRSLPDGARERVLLCKADLSSYEEMLQLAEFVRRETDALDWLVCNTGISTYRKFSEYTFEEWEKIMDTNLSIPAFLVKELLPFMREKGSILFMGSFAGRQAYSSSLVYGVTKAGVHFLAKSLVKEAEPKGVRVNAVAPGFIETPWHAGRSEESYERINRKIALHRFGETSEVADLAVSVLKNGYMNGSILDIHGGYDYF